MTTTPCPKCSGTGRIGFSAVDGGRCFRCDGLGSIEAMNAARRAHAAAYAEQLASDPAEQWYKIGGEAQRLIRQAQRAARRAGQDFDWEAAVSAAFAQL